MKKGKLILLIISTLFIVFLLYFIIINAMRPENDDIIRIATERTNIIKNRLEVYTSSEINPDSLFIYFIKESNRMRIPNDTLLVYNANKEYIKIPDQYGKSHFVLKYGDVIYDRMGLWKFKAWYKHDYKIQISKLDTTLVIAWEIKNKKEHISIVDTITLIK